MSAAAAAAAARALGLSNCTAQALGAGTWRLGTNAFLKVLPRAQAARLEAEADGLAALADSVRVPRILGRGTGAGHAWLALEWLDLGRADDAAAARLGRALAGLHRRSAATFGWDGDNWIGASPQANGRNDDWAPFFAERRLLPQLRRARRRAGGAALAAAGERLCAQLPRLLAGHAPPPALIHGDLWAGNWGVLPDGEPVVFDPAVHFADRECDLAMTALFGGFPAAFYAAYEEAWPLPPGHETRRALYQLYHLLNHYNLFGAGYERQCLSLIHGIADRNKDGA